MKTPLYQQIASLLQAIKNCQETDNKEWQEKHVVALDQLIKLYLPSGSGFDLGTTINLEKSTPDKLVFETAFHHMNEDGYYDGWTNHTVIITPSLSVAFYTLVTGKNKNDIKDYVADCFCCALTTETEN
jgi:hypothetical protein